jgi:ATP-binding cassette subfamily B protein
MSQTGNFERRQADWRTILLTCARFWFARPGRTWVVVGLIAAVALADVTISLALGGVIGAVATPAASNTLLAIAWLLAGGAALICHALLRLSFDIVWNRVSINSMNALQAEAFSRVQRFSSAWHGDTFAGATVHRLSRARWAIDAIGVVIFSRMATPLLMILVIGTLVSIRLPIAGAVFFLVSAVYLWVSFELAARWVRPANVVSARLEADLTGAIADAIANNSAVKAFGAETREESRLAEAAERWSSKATVSMDRTSLMQTVQLGLWAVLQTTVLATLVIFAGDGGVTPADLGFAIAAILQLGGQLRGIGGDIRMLQRAFGEFGETMDFLTASFDVADPAEPKPMPAARGEIAFDGVTFRYGQRAPLFDQLSLRIAPGEHVALVGATGSGKSTFVKLLQRLYDVDSGEIRIDGVNIGNVEQANLRRQVAIVPQEPALFHRTLAENIAYGRPESTEAEIIAAARKARAHDFIMASPNGYGTLVGERGLKLSGGERQRVAIARAFLSNAPIVVFDEATASLDTLTERMIQEAMQELMEGRTTVIIAHRLSTVRKADRIMVFDGGRIVEEGKHSDLVQRPHGLYRRLVGDEINRIEIEAA